MENAKNEVQQAGTALNRALSQRAAQHDAHLTSINALILASSPPPIDALKQVIRNIMRFYPRIAGVDIVQLDRAGAHILIRPILMIDEKLGGDIVADFAPKLADQKPGIVHTYLTSSDPDRYYLGKKSDNSNPGYAILMEINPALMIEPDERPEWADLTLQINGQTILKQAASSDMKVSAFLEQPTYSQFIDSQNQPILLTITRPMDIKQIIELKLTILFSIISLIVMIATFALWRSFLHAKQVEKRAQLLEHETRLAHAARVNSMGELASGIAHELTQPLTALLSQSQAALRMEASGEHGEMLQQALTANVRQAARAGEILQRMRQYMSNKQPSHKLVEVNQAIHDVSELLQTDLTLRRITLKTQMITPSPVIVADAVEIEQVLYNLVRNAADSLDEVSKDEKQVTISSAIDDGEAIINVTDNGRGIADDILPHLFEPFFTTRRNGMGLGLSLCATLIERVGGEISAQNRPEGGALFTIIIPTAEPGSTKATA